MNFFFKNLNQSLPPMSSFRGNVNPSSSGVANQNPAIIFNASVSSHPHISQSQHSPALQNDSHVGKNLQPV
jgi:hypothetical protein